MKRREHYFESAKAQDMPQQCIWFDTETRMTLEDRDPFLHSDVIWYGTHTEFKPKLGDTVYHWLKFGYACYMRKHRDGEWTDEQWLRFTTRTEFWDFVHSKARGKTKLYLFCHNTNFDLPVLDVFGELSKREWILRSAIIDGPPTILRFRNGTKCIMILDTLNIWRMPLKFLGEEIGLAKLDMPDNNDLALDWESYGKRDVEILRAALIKWWEFLKRNNYGSFACTLAGQSMKLYRHRYLTHPIFIDSNEGSLKLTREGYYGGRVECFRIGRFKGSFSALDVNSMYPYVMAFKEYPCKLVSHTNYCNVSDIGRWLTRYCVTARVTLRTHTAFAAIRRNGKLMFPIGEFECILSTSELQYALEHAEILQVKECAVYEKAYLFTQMVTDLYEHKKRAKLSGDTVSEFMYKKLLNSFYGKWGQSGGKWLEEDNINDLTCRRWLDYDLETGKVTHHRQFGGLVQSKSEESESRDSFPAIAAHVTANARLVLWEIILQAGLENTYYCDTDCVVVNDEGRKRLEFRLNEELLGGLKLAGEYDDIQIWGNKDYRFGSKVKTKGVRKQAIWHGDHEVQQDKWSGLRGLVASGLVTRPITQTIKKKLSRLYDKGEILQDGSVQPFLIAGELYQ